MKTLFLGLLCWESLLCSAFIVPSADSNIKISSAGSTIEAPSANSTIENLSANITVDLGADSSALKASLNATLTDERTMLPEVSWGRYRFSASIASGGPRVDIKLYEKLQQYYATAPPAQLIGSDTILLKTIYRVMESLSAGGFKTVPLTNADAASIVQYVVTLLNDGGQWADTHGEYLSIVVEVDGRMGYIFFEWLTVGEPFSLSDDGFEWTGVNFPDATFPDVVGAEVVNQLLNQVRDWKLQQHDTPVAVGTNIRFLYQRIDVSLSFSNEGGKAWPRLTWNDIEVVVKHLNDQYRAKKLYHDTWLQLKYQPQSGKVMTIGLLTLSDRTKYLEGATTGPAQLTNSTVVSN